MGVDVAQRPWMECDSSGGVGWAVIVLGGAYCSDSVVERKSHGSPQQGQTPDWVLAESTGDVTTKRAATARRTANSPSFRMIFLREFEPVR